MTPYLRLCKKDSHNCNCNVKYNCIYCNARVLLCLLEAPSDPRLQYAFVAVSRQHQVCYCIRFYPFSALSTFPVRWFGRFSFPTSAMCVCWGWPSILCIGHFSHFCLCYWVSCLYILAYNCYVGFFALPSQCTLEPPFFRFNLFLSRRVVLGVLGIDSGLRICAGACHICTPMFSSIRAMSSEIWCTRWCRHTLWCGQSLFRPMAAVRLWEPVRLKYARWIITRQSTPGPRYFKFSVAWSVVALVALHQCCSTNVLKYVDNPFAFAYNNSADLC